MRQLNFLIIFLVILFLVIFSLENTLPATIQITPAWKITAPLAIELIVVMGLGAVIAWLFSSWASMQGMMQFYKKNQQIDTLQQQVTQLAVKIDERKQLSASAIDVEVEDKTKAMS